MVITIKAKLLQEQYCIDNYILYVFENTEDAPFGHNYVITTRFPNWDHPELEVGTIGYLTYKEVVAGEDTWYDKETNQRIPYNYSNLVFIRFIPIKEEQPKQDIIV